MSTETAEILAAVAGLALLAGIGLDVMLRPLPVLAPTRQRRRRYALWGSVTALYLALLLLA